MEIVTSWWGTLLICSAVWAATFVVPMWYRFYYPFDYPDPRDSDGAFIFEINSSRINEKLIFIIAALNAIFALLFIHLVLK
jgi:hypothetical protein